MGTRVLIFVRHGQYHLDETHPRHGKLTPLGVRQAKKVASRLVGYPVRVVHSSTMARAFETAALICRGLGTIPFRKTHLLREGIPLPYPGITAPQRSRMLRARTRMDRA